MNRRRFGQIIAATGIAHAFRHLSAQPSLKHGFRFSVMLWTLEKQAPFDSCIETVAAAGYEGIELVGEFHTWSAEERRRVMSRMRSLHLQFDMLSGVKAGFADPAGASELLTQLGAQINFAKEFESPQINLKSGARISGLSPELQRAACIENLKRAADLAGAHNLQIVIESIDPIESPEMYMTSVTEAFAIVRGVGSPHVRVLYDFYHEQRAAGNLLEKLERNFDLVGLVHVADAPERHEPGTGEINYANIYKTLARLNYDKFIAMEFYPIRDPVSTLRRARLDALQMQVSNSL